MFTQGSNVTSSSVISSLSSGSRGISCATSVWNASETPVQCVCVCNDLSPLYRATMTGADRGCLRTLARYGRAFVDDVGIAQMLHIKLVNP
jgi:hypothetical protein